MESTKQLICLANSRKHGGRCIAGIDLQSNAWVRPISSRSGHEVSERERQYLDGTEPRVLDVISMKIIRRQSSGFQRENWILDSSVRWSRMGRVEWEDLRPLEQRPSRLWINSDDSTMKGVNDRIPVTQSERLTDSLKIIRVDSVTIIVDQPFEMGRGLEVRAEFWHSSSPYILKVTDCVYADRFRRKGVGRYRLGESFLTVSLGEEWKDYYYKLVAAIIERPKV
ncbi:dual OB domain-containing protein [Streptomyces olivaceus]|uniref:dual OB domain-containing protein n=1 Tax=Streptomyces olivaceus TaxID=47716 RepID=UPI0038249DD8